MKPGVSTRGAVVPSLLCIAVVLACKGTHNAGSDAGAQPSPAPAEPPRVIVAVLGKAPASGPRIRLGLQKGQVVSPNRWPDACQLVTKQDVEAIFPGATNIEREAKAVLTRTIEEFAANSPAKDDYAAKGGCVYSLQLPGESHPRTQIWVRIVAVADRDLIDRYYRHEFYFNVGQPRSGVRGVDDCTTTSVREGNLVCRHGPLIFEVGGYGTAHFKETAEFGIAPRFFWRDKVLPELASSIAAKLAEST